MAWSSDMPAGALAEGRRQALPYAAGLLLGTTLGLFIAGYSYKSLAVFAGIIIAGVIFWRPYVGFLLVVASLPADVSGVIAGGASSIVLSVTKILGAITLAAAMFDVLIRQRRPSLRRLLTRETVAAGLFTAITAVSGVLHWSENTGSEVLRLLTILIFVFITVYFVDRPGRVVHVLYVVAAVATVVALQSFVQRGGAITSISEEWVAEAGAVLDVSEETVGRMLRTTGTFSHPAWLGLFLSLAIPMTLFVAWTTRYRLVAAAGLLAVGLQILGVFSTYSRMAYIGAAMGITLFTIRRRFGPGMLVSLLLAAVVAFPALPNEVRARVHSILEYQQSSSSLTRIAQQMAGWSMFLDHPLVGVGPGGFEKYVLDYASGIPERYRVEPIGAHNMYVEIAAELGAPGLAAAVLLLGLCCWDARQLRRNAAAKGDVRTALLWECLGVAMLVFILSAMFVHAQTRKEWWLIVGLIAAGRSFCREMSDPCPQEAAPP